MLMSCGIENNPYMEKLIKYNDYFEKLYNGVSSLDDEKFGLMYECLKKIRIYHGKLLVEQYQLCTNVLDNPSDIKYYELSMYDDTIDICKKMTHQCEKKFEETIIRYNKPSKTQSGGAVFEPHLINFYASWCGACTSFKPVWDELEKHYTGKTIVTSAIECGDNPEIMSKHNISHFPTIRLYMVGGGEKNIYEYTEKRELDNMIKWIEEHIKN